MEFIQKLENRFYKGFRLTLSSENYDDFFKGYHTKKYKSDYTLVYRKNKEKKGFKSFAYTNPLGTSDFLDILNFAKMDSKRLKYEILIYKTNELRKNKNVKEIMKI